MPVRALLAVVLGAAVLATIAAPAVATPAAPRSPEGRRAQLSCRCTVASSRLMPIRAGT